MSLKVKETVNAIVLEQLEKGGRRPETDPEFHPGLRRYRKTIRRDKPTHPPDPENEVSVHTNCRLTFRMVNQVCGSVGKGEKGTRAFYFKMLEGPDAET